MFYLLSLLISMQLSPKISIGMHLKDFVNIYAGQEFLITNNGNIYIIKEKILDKELEWMYSFKDSKLMYVNMIYIEKEVTESKFTDCRKIYDKILETLNKDFGRAEIKEGKTNYTAPDKNLTGYEISRAIWKNTDGSEIALKFKLIDSDNGFKYMIRAKMY